VEISCHGNQFVAERILSALLRKVRWALPGEFTQRAFLNNKIDLTQAEAVADLLAAATVNSQRLALNLLEGKLAVKINNLLQILTHYRLLLELEIDFSEDTEGELDYKELSRSLTALESDLARLAASGHDGMILRDGFRVCLVGQTNVGKSSIFNRILETERAIVTPIPGTTRDYLEEALALEGFLIRLFDTAGIRHTDNVIEKIGIERSYEIIRNAHLIVYVSDGGEDTEDLKILMELAEREKIIKVLNKSDIVPAGLQQQFIQKDYILCSAVEKGGLFSLKKALLSKTGINPDKIPEILLSNTRQIAAVQKAGENVRQAQKAVQDGISAEFIAFDLQEASKNLEDITGVITTDAILDQIFSGFCIGK
jgi:tRNA modification GTPase